MMSESRTLNVFVQVIGELKLMENTASFRESVKQKNIIKSSSLTIEKVGFTISVFIKDFTVTIFHSKIKQQSLKTDSFSLASRSDERVS